MGQRLFQFLLVSMLCLSWPCGALSWSLILRGHDGLAGLVLALATIKPSVTLLPIAMILLWATRWKRWNINLGFLIAITILTGFTLIRIGWWIPDFITQGLSYRQDNQGVGLEWSPEAILTLPGFLWLSGTAIILGIGLRRLLHNPELPWMASMGAINLNLLLTPHTGEYDLTILLVSLLWLGMEWSAHRWSVLLWLTLVWTPWLLWLIVLTFHPPTDAWWANRWFLYPNLLLAITLLWLGRDIVRNRIRKTCITDFSSGWRLRRKTF